MLYQQIASNKRKTVLVVLGFLLLVGMIGAAIGYTLLGVRRWVWFCDRLGLCLHVCHVRPVN